MVSVSRLRYWFAVAAVAVVLVVAGFYFYARYRILRTVKDVPAKLGIEIQQSTEAFSLSKSEGGRTLFTIRASKAIQYKKGGLAELHNVNIVVYGRESNRFDQIYGDDFEYDQQTGNATAKGVVHIDLEANPGADVHPELGPPAELKNPIHLKTSGLVFNQKTGLAKTDELIDFRMPQASGTARGATYNSKANALTLASAIHVQTIGERAIDLSAAHGVISKDPRRAVLDQVKIDRKDSSLSADKATVFLRDDNTVDHVLAEGNVETRSTGETSLTTHSPRAELMMTAKNRMRSAIMSGGVVFDSVGTSRIAGNANRLIAEFGPEGKMEKARASDGVKLLQEPAPASSQARSQAQKRARSIGSSDAVEMTAQAMDFFVKNGRQLDRAETDGPGQITITPRQNQATASSTVITAAQFRAGFDGARLSGVHGAPNARVVQTTPGQPDRVTTSDAVDAIFSRSGAITGFVQQGNFQYREGQPGTKSYRAASADKASYSNATQVLTLEGSPRVIDGGMTATAQVIHLNKRTGDADAENQVKTTYSELKPQAGGALLASADPIHVTASRMSFDRSTGIARYTGGARLWQGGNIVEAPSITFNRDSRAMDAIGASGRRVSTVLVQRDKKGNDTPVQVSAARLSYTDQQRKARFEGGVVIRTGDGTVLADHVVVLLKASGNKGQQPAGASATPSQLEQIVAEGHVVLEEPTRRGTGDKLVYTADDGKFVLTGGPPRIVDAQQGSVTGVSLTFYSHDDRVLVEGGPANRAVTTTRVSK
jgi:lipopolysaccharide export system protein LptA